MANDPTHDSAEKILAQSIADDLESRQAQLQKSQSLHVGKITGQTTPNDASGPAEVKPR